MSTNEQSFCINCRYFGGGLCNFRHPTGATFSSTARCWPKVEPSDWCGYHVAADAPQPEQTAEQRIAELERENQRLSEKVGTIKRAAMDAVGDCETWPDVLSKAPALRAELAAEKAKREEAQNDADEEWLDAIGKEWMALTGQPWDTRDGELREEGLKANVSALFAALSASQQREKELRDVAYRLNNLAKYHAAYSVELEDAFLSALTQPEEKK